MICMFKTMYYWYLIYLGTFRNYEIYELNPTRFLVAQRLGWQAPLNKKKAKLGLMVEE